MYTQDNRFSNFELLRIVLMILIIAHHYAIFSGINLIFGDVITKLNFYLEIILMSGGKIGVDCFLIMTGFFMSHKCFSLLKLCKLAIQILICNIIILSMVYCLDIMPLNSIDLFSALSPLGNNNWFAHTYLILYVLIPVLNAIINKMSKDCFGVFVGAVFLYYFVWPTLTFFIPLLGEALFTDIETFVAVYFIGAFISRHEVPTIKIKHILYMFIMLYMFYLGLNILEMKFGISFRIYRLMTSHSLFVLFISAGLFVYTMQHSIKCNRLINCLASSTFGVYLLHDNDLIRVYLWQNIFSGASYFQSIYFFPYSVWAILSTFFVCSLVELIRIKYVEKILIKYACKIESFEYLCKTKILSFLYLQ